MSNISHPSVASRGRISLLAGFVTVLVAVSCLVGMQLVQSPPAAAAVVNTGTLDVREYIVSGCSYNRELEDLCKTDVPWFPSEFMNAEAIRVGSGQGGTPCDPAFQISGSSVAVGPPGIDCEFDADETGVLRTTPNLLASIYSGVDAYGLPDLPGNGTPNPYVPPADLGTEANVECTTAQFSYTDIGTSTCGATTRSQKETSWSIVEGWIQIPASPNGQVLLRQSNTDEDGAARAQYNAFMIAPDEDPANLQFRSEGQTYGSALNNTTVPVATPTSTTNVCGSEYRYVRLYDMDNSSGTAARVTWSLDNGATFEPIPSSALTNVITGAECGATSKTLTTTPTRNADGTFNVNYRVSVFNQGRTPLENVQISDDLLAAPSTFPATTQIISAAAVPVVGTACATWAVNAGFDGSSNPQIFTGTDDLPEPVLIGSTLGPPVRCSVDLTFRLRLPTTQAAVYDNSAVSSWDTVSGSRASDPSNNATDPADVGQADPDNDGNANEPNENNPTPAPFPGEVVPAAVDDSDLDNIIGTPVSVDVLVNDTTGLDPTTVVIIGAPGDGKTLVVPGEGTWTVDPATGVITFTPDADFEGDPTPIDYQVSDADGAIVTATVTITYLDAPAPPPTPPTDPSPVPTPDTPPLAATGPDIATPLTQGGSLILLGGLLLFIGSCKRRI